MPIKELDSLIEAQILEDSLYGSALGLYSIVSEDVWEGPPPEVLAQMPAETAAQSKARKLRDAQASVGIKPLQHNIPPEHVVPAKKENETPAEKSARIAKTVGRENEVEASMKGSELGRATAREVRAGIIGASGEQVFPPDEAETKRVEKLKHLPGKHTTGEDVPPEEFQARAEQERIDTLQANPDTKREQYVGFQSQEAIAAAREQERLDAEKQGINRFETEQKLQLDARKARLAGFKKEVAGSGFFRRMIGSVQARGEAAKIAKAERQIGRISTKGGLASFNKAVASKADAGAGLLLQDAEWAKRKIGGTGEQQAPESAGSSPKSANTPKPSAGTAPGPAAAETPEQDLDPMSIVNARGLFYRQATIRGRIMTPISGAVRLAKTALRPWEAQGRAAASAPSGPPGRLR